MALGLRVCALLDASSQTAHVGASAESGEGWAYPKGLLSGFHQAISFAQFGPVQQLVRAGVID
jgi:hypothetical protein